MDEVNAQRLKAIFDEWQYGDYRYFGTDVRILSYRYKKRKQNIVACVNSIYGVFNVPGLMYESGWRLTK